MTRLSDHHGETPVSSSLPYSAETLLEDAVKRFDFKRNNHTVNLTRERPGLPWKLTIDGIRLEMSFETGVEATTFISMFWYKVTGRALDDARKNVQYPGRQKP